MKNFKLEKTIELTFEAKTIDKKEFIFVNGENIAVLKPLSIGFNVKFFDSASKFGISRYHGGLVKTKEIFFLDIKSKLESYFNRVRR